MNYKFRNRIFSGLLWSCGERMTAQLVSFLVSIILARMVTPREYGVIALVMIFISIGNIFVTDGFGNALVQKQNADTIDFSSVFLFSLILSVLLYGLLYWISPFIAEFYDLPVLKNVIRIMGIRIILASVNTVQRAYISKKMEFRKFFFSTIIGTIISAITGILMAYKGYGVWALVIQYLTNSLIDTTILSVTSGWKISFKFSFKRLKPLISYGWGIFAVALMNALYSNLRNFVIGKRFSTDDLAYSTKGQQFPGLVAANINNSINAVLFPAVSMVQEDKNKMLSVTRRMIQIETFFVGPLLFGLAAVSPLCIRLLLTEKWLQCVPYLKIMCGVYVLQPIQMASIQAMKAMGYSELYFRLDIIKKAVALIILFIAVFYYNSVFDIVMSALAAEICATIINFPVNKKLIAYGYLEQIRDVLSPLIASAFMYWIVTFVNQKVEWMESDILRLGVLVVFGCMAYILICYMMKLDSLFYIFNFIKEKKEGGKL
ncbi:lipopolysaccharide biosynthesis protein [Clostridiaceae bacterium]|nr:lipopolysaccharide biosynthesis protein [Clostridiaceae bacterium]